MTSSIKPLPIDCWLADMTAAIGQIAELGTSILAKHRLASAEAVETADRWHLAERRADECESLSGMVQSVRQIIVSIDECRHLLHDDVVDEDVLHQAMNRCAETIDARLPGIEQAFVTFRRAALDLLQWTQRSARLDDSTLPSEYRASYARLLAHTHVFKPLLDEYGIIYEALKKMPDNQLKLKFLESLAELEDNECHRQRRFPKTRLHRVRGVKQAVYRADVTKISGWRIHLQYLDGKIVLKDVIEGSRHDDAVKVIRTKKGRYH